MSVMISGRVPDELAIQGSDVLKSIGASRTQLINSAFQYLLDNGALPGSVDQKQAAQGEGEPAPITHRRLEGAALKDFTMFFNSSTLPLGTFPTELEGVPYDEILADALAADYEALD